MYRIGAVALILAGGLVTQLVVAANPVERNGQVVSIALAKRFSVAVASTMGGQIYGNLNIGFANSAVSPRGDLVAVGSTEDPGNQAGAPFRSSGYKVTNIVDIKTGKTIARIQDAWPVAFSPDGNTLLVKQYFTRAIQKAGLGIGAVLSVPPTTQLWDLSKPEKPVQRFVIDAATVEAFSDDGKILVCYAGSKGKMGNSGKPVAGLPRFDRKKLPGGGGGVIFAVDSIDLIELWEVETGNLLARMRPPKNHGPELAPAIFHPNGHVVAIPLSDLSALANIRGAARPQDLDRFWNTVSSKIVLFDFKAKKKIQTIACPGKINQMRFIRPSASMLESTGRPLLVVSTFKRAEASLFIFDPETGKRTATLLEKKGPGAKIKFALSPVEATLAAEFSFTEKNPGPGKPIPANPQGGGLVGGFGGQPNNNGAAGGIGGFAGGFAGGGAGGFAGGGAGGFGGQPNNGPGGGFVGGGGFGGGQIGVGGGFAGGFAGGGAGGFQGIPAAPQPRFVKGAVSVFHLAKFDKVVEWDRPAFGLTFANEDILATVEVADKETVVVFRDVRTGKIISKQSGCSGVTFLEDGEIMVSTDMTAEQPSLTVWTVDYKPRK